MVKNLHSGTKLNLNPRSTSCVSVTKLFNLFLPRNDSDNSYLTDLL